MKPIHEIELKDGRKLKIYLDEFAEDPRKMFDFCGDDEIKAWERGEVYGYELGSDEICDSCGRIEWVIEDSCWGFYGYDIDNMLVNAGLSREVDVAV